MQRYNIFNLKHKGLRAMLYDTAIILQHTSFEDQESSAETIKKVKAVLHAFLEHAAHEDKYVLPAIKKYDTELVHEFESEHGIDELLTQNINSLVIALQTTTTTEAMIEAGYALTMAFNEFIAFNLYHMNKEENKINKTLWKYYTDAELIHITQLIIACIPAHVMSEEAYWMMKGISNTEIITWLRSIKNSAPDHVFKSFFTIAEAVLPQERLNAVQEALTEGAMVA